MSEAIGVQLTNPLCESPQEDKTAQASWPLNAPGGRFYAEWDDGAAKSITLLLLGIETPTCIYQTAIQALGKDMGVTLFSDCIGERCFEDRASTLQQLLTMAAHVLPSETIFYSLLSSADHLHFRAFTKLVEKYG